ncbi:MAG: CcdB family protein [Solimonas sp.]
MAQFDVHRNPGRHRDDIPYVVVVQSAVFDGYQRRVVIPLVKKSRVGSVQHARFNPVFTIKGMNVVLHPLEIVSVPEGGLGVPIASLAEQGDLIMGALDELLTRAYG